MIESLQALLAVPPAIIALKDILEGDQSNIADAKEKLEKLRASLIDFAESYKWLEEIKEYHDILTMVDNQGVIIFDLCVNSLPNNQFDHQRFSYNEFKRLWSVMDGSVKILIRFMQDIKTFDDGPLRISDDGRTARGAPKQIQLFNMWLAINDQLESYDYNDPVNSGKNVVNHTIRLKNHLKDLIIDANFILKSRARDISEELLRLRGGLSDE